MLEGRREVKRKGGVMYYETIVGNVMSEDSFEFPEFALKFFMHKDLKRTVRNNQLIGKTQIEHSHFN